MKRAGGIQREADDSSDADESPQAATVWRRCASWNAMPIGTDWIPLLSRMKRLILPPNNGLQVKQLGTARTLPG